MTAVPPHFTADAVLSTHITVETVAGYAGMRPSPAPSKPQCPRRPPPGLHYPRLAVGDLTIPLLLIGVGLY